MFSEVAITFNAAVDKNDTSSVSHIWDIRSGVLLASLKHSHSNCSAILPLTGYGGRTYGILVSLSDRPTLHYYAWTKDQPQVRMTLPERMGAIIASNSGFLIGGGESGKLYIWEITSGNLLNVIDAHYRAIRSMKFSIDDRMLVTVGDDALCHSWNLSNLFSKTTKPMPDSTFQSHTLSLTDVQISMSFPPTIRAYTASLDRTVKIWHMSSKTLLSTISFPNPILSIAIDPTETRLFAGGDSGVIYGVELYPKQSDGTRKTMSSRDIEDGSSFTYTSHTGKITGLALSFDSTLLISASMDCTAIVWDVVSRQSLRTFSEHKVPLTALHVIVRPADLLDTKLKLPTTDVLPLKRYMTSNEANTINGPHDMVDIPMHMDSELIPKKEPRFVPFAQSLQMARESGGTEATLTEVENLRNEVNRLTRMNTQLKTVNDELYHAAVEQFSRQQIQPRLHE